MRRNMVSEEAGTAGTVPEVQDAVLEPATKAHDKHAYMSAREAIAVFLEMITVGDISVDAEGRIWRHAIFQGNSHKGGRIRVLLSCPRRAERMPCDRLHYPYLRFLVNGRWAAIEAHRVVWEATRGKIPEGFDINHLDGNKLNNHPGNLEVCTRADNNRHARRTGLCDLAGVRNPQAVLTDALVSDIRRRHRHGETRSTIAEALGVYRGTIWHVIKGRTWKHVT